MDDNYSESGSVGFNIDSNYSNSYLRDTYESEDYLNQKKLVQAISEAFDTFVNDFPEYDRLRIIDVNKIRVGDRVQYSGQRGIPQVIEFINHQTVVLRSEEGDTVQEVPRCCIEPTDNPLVKLKGKDLKVIYCEIKRHCGDEYSESMVFFACFLDYFKVNSSLLWQVLPISEQTKLLEELDGKTGEISKRKFKVEW